MSRKAESKMKVQLLLLLLLLSLSQLTLNGWQGWSLLHAIYSTITITLQSITITLPLVGPLVIRCHGLKNYSKNKN